MCKNRYAYIYIYIYIYISLSIYIPSVSLCMYMSIILFMFWFTCEEMIACGCILCDMILVHKYIENYIYFLYRKLFQYLIITSSNFEWCATQCWYFGKSIYDYAFVYLFLCIRMSLSMWKFILIHVC